jgi:photosystem II stability/assembly factor-like uncharacterized protein
MRARVKARVAVGALVSLGGCGWFHSKASSNPGSPGVELLGPAHADELPQALVWSDGRTMLADDGATLLRSTDGGDTFAVVQHTQTLAAGLIGEDVDGQNAPLVARCGSVLLLVRDGQRAPVDDNDEQLGVENDDQEEEGPDPTVWRSSDNGATWKDTPMRILVDGNAVIPDFSVSSLFSLVCMGDTALIAGDDGIILRSTDGGLIWSLRPSATSTTFYSATVAGSTYLAAGWGGIVARSTDGGTTFHTQVLPVFDPKERAVIKELTGFGDGQVIGHVDVSLIRSTDAGATWTRSPFTAKDPDLSTLFARSPTDLLVITPEHHGYNSDYFRSVDGGATWSAPMDPSNHFEVVPCESGGFFVADDRGLFLTP